MYRLVFYSRNCVRDREMLQAEIRDILAVSRINNAAAGVTGALMFNAGCFAQVLEGECDALEATFERIQQDERHAEVSLLDFAPADARAFGGWSMGFVGTSHGDAGRFASIAAETGFDPAFLTSDGVFQVLCRLALEQERVE